MSDYFAFRFYEPSEEKRKSLVIFFVEKVSLNTVSKAIKQDITENLVPKNVYLMTLENSLIGCDNCKDDNSFVSEFTSYVGEIDNHLHCLSADGYGKLSYCDKSAVPQNITNAILQSGMIDLFKKHSGLISSSHGYHFLKPSGDHCDKFIRASNLLVSSIEVSFLAISLLPYFRYGLKRIYVDTSSIAYLVSIAIQLFVDFRGSVPSVESFESYAVLDEDYDFVENKSSLLFISATTSGSLTKKLLSRTSYSKEQVVTLFHVNLPEGQEGIFDVTSAISSGIDSRKASVCEFCKRGSKLIRIAGDQFLPENPKHELLVIRKANFSRQRQDFFEQFAITSVLKWNCSVSTNDDNREHFFIDVDKALSLETKTFSPSLLKNIKRYISRDLAVVVTLADAGSKALEKKLRDNLGEGADGIKWFSPESLEEEGIVGSASVIVCAGAITSGRSLLAISRKLRKVDPSATITYFVAFSKLPNKVSFEQLQKDLQQGGHNLVVLSHCPVPRVKQYTKTAWDWEREVLFPFSDDDPLGYGDVALPETLSERLLLLTGEANDDNSLFLLDPCKQPMKLRRTFAFWSDLGFSDEKIENTTQSDVYWTVQCILHDLRNDSENNGLATTYHTTLISPANFDRYNDGVIQACLLRSALPVEMDYRVDTVFSRQMTDVICSVITNWKNAQGEASMEFLMALWTKRLRINDDHFQEIISLKTDEMPCSMIFLLECLTNP